MTEIPVLDKKGLREFAIVTGAILALIFGILLPWIFERPYPYWPWIVFFLIASIGGIRYYLNTEQGEYQWDRVKLKLPLMFPAWGASS